MMVQKYGHESYIADIFNHWWSKLDVITMIARLHGVFPYPVKPILLICKSLFEFVLAFGIDHMLHMWNFEFVLAFGIDHMLHMCNFSSRMSRSPVPNILGVAPNSVLICIS